MKKPDHQLKNWFEVPGRLFRCRPVVFLFFHLNLALLILFSSPPNYAESMPLVIQSFKIKPYDEALEGCRSVLGLEIRSIVSNDLSEGEVSSIIRRLKPDIVIAIGMDALLKVASVRNIPVVYVMVLNPGPLIKGRSNLCGVSMNVSPDKQLSLLHQSLPSIRKICVLYDPEINGNTIDRISRSADSLGIRVTVKEVRSPKEAVSAVATFCNKVDALLLIPDTTVLTPNTADLILLSAMENRIPVLSFAGKYAEKGAVLSIEVDAVEAGRQAGEIARRVLSGTDIRNIDRQEARASVITVNTIVAKKLGVAISSKAMNSGRIIP